MTGPSGHAENAAAAAAAAIDRLEQRLVYPDVATAYALVGLVHAVLELAEQRQQQTPATP